tara:strand:+ start:353 stop:517 length:165 start_codon:yes stop_codon:yes gene_type:complete
MSINSDLNKKTLKPITITDIKLPKNIDKLNFGLILCDKKNVAHATIIENNSSKT